LTPPGFAAKSVKFQHRETGREKHRENRLVAALFRRKVSFLVDA
jgi:hypothetical protein